MGYHAQGIYCENGESFTTFVTTQRIYTFTYPSLEPKLCLDYEVEDSWSFLSIGDNVTATQERLIQRLHFMEDTMLISWKQWLYSYTLSCEEKEDTRTITCTLHISPYGIFCYRVCSKQTHVEVKKREEEVYGQWETQVYMGTSFLLYLLSYRLSRYTGSIYLTGGIIGATLSFAMIFLAFIRLTTNESPTKRHVSVAAIVQVGFLYFRRQFESFLYIYRDVVMILLLVSILVSMLAVHYFITRDVEKNKRFLRDVVYGCLKGGAILLLLSCIPSARYRIVCLFLLMTTEYLFSYMFSVENNKIHLLTEKEYQEQGRQYTKDMLHKLKDQEAFLTWMMENHHRIQLRPSFRNEGGEDGEGGGVGERSDSE
jgi:hypothetical protein